MASSGALTFGDLWSAPIPEAISTIGALGYILEERARAAEAEVRRLRAPWGVRR